MGQRSRARGGAIPKAPTSTDNSAMSEVATMLKSMQEKEVVAISVVVTVVVTVVVVVIIVIVPATSIATMTTASVTG